jgi:hypothetical protein
MVYYNWDHLIYGRNWACDSGAAEPGDSPIAGKMGVGIFKKK